MGADANHLASLALLKIKGDLAKDGREPLATDSPATSKKMWDSLSAKKPLFTVSPKKQNGLHLVVDKLFHQIFYNPVSSIKHLNPLLLRR